MDYKERVIALLNSQELSKEQKEKLEEIFPELKESEGEKIRKALIRYFTLSDEHAYDEACGVSYRDIVAWLEKQGEHANFRNKIQIGDKVTRNEDGVLVNLSQLNRVAKKQGEQKPAEWSEEDKQAIEDAETWLDTLCDYLKDSSSECIPTVKNVISKLKSLRPQNKWKPSDEQMEAIRIAAEVCTANDSWAMNILRGIYNELKELREE